MGRETLDVIDDYDSETEMEAEIIKSKVKKAMGNEKSAEAEAEKDFKAIEIAIKGGATREQAIEQLAASKAAIETNEEES